MIFFTGVRAIVITNNEIALKEAPICYKIYLTKKFVNFEMVFAYKTKCIVCC